MHRKRVPIALGTTYVVPPKPADPFSASPNAQSNARYVSAVVSRSMAHDARKGAALAARRTYESSLLERLRAEAFALKPTTTEPAAATWEPPAVGDRGAQEVVHWVACLAKQLSAADACAPSAPAGATAAEVAAVLGAPLQRKRLEFSTDSPDERARRLAKLLGALLDHHSNLCRRADSLLNRVPPLLRELAPRRHPLLERAAALPPPLAVAVLSQPQMVTSLETYFGLREDGASGALLSALREWGHDGLGALRHHPPWLRPEEMAALPAQQQEALRAAAAAAVALCQAVHWAERLPGAPSLLPTDGGKPTAAAAAEAVAAAEGTLAVAVAAEASEGEGEAATAVDEPPGSPWPPSPPPSPPSPGSSPRGLAAMTPRDHFAPLNYPTAQQRVAPPARVRPASAGATARSPARSRRKEAVDDDSWLAQVAAVAQATHNAGEWRPDGRALPYQQLLPRLATRLCAPAPLLALRDAAAAAAAKSGEETASNLRLALLVSVQAYVALVAQSLGALLAAAPPAHLSHNERLQLSHAASLRHGALSSTAAFLRTPALLHSCAASAADGEHRALAARCAWAANLALLADPAPPAADGTLAAAAAARTAEVGASLGLAALRASLAAAAAARAEPVAVLAMQVQAAALVSMRVRPLPAASPSLLWAAAAAADHGGGGAARPSSAPAARHASRARRQYVAPTAYSPWEGLGAPRRAASTTTVGGGGAAAAASRVAEGKAAGGGWLVALPAEKRYGANAYDHGSGSRRSSFDAAAMASPPPSATAAFAAARAMRRRPSFQFDGGVERRPPSSLPRPARPASASASLMRSRSVPVGLMDDLLT